MLNSVTLFLSLVHIDIAKWKAEELILSICIAMSGKRFWNPLVASVLNMACPSVIQKQKSVIVVFSFSMSGVGDRRAEVLHICG